MAKIQKNLLVSQNQVQDFSKKFLAIACLAVSRVLQLEELIIGYEVSSKEFARQWQEITGPHSIVIPYSVLVEKNLMINDFVAGIEQKILPSMSNSSKFPCVKLLDSNYRKNINLMCDFSFSYNNNVFEDHNNSNLHFHFDNSNAIQGSFKVTISFDNNKFNQSIIERIYNTWCMLLSAGENHTEVKIKDACLIDHKGKNKVTKSFNKTAIDFAHNKNIVDLFYQQVQHDPERIR